MSGLIGKQLDQYRLTTQIGQGGMAMVYRAMDVEHEREVAVKVLSPTVTGDRRFLRRFRREAEVVKQRLKHPHIVPVIGYGEVEGYVYLVMPYIPGDTLADRLGSGGITQEQAARWVDQICQALDFAHRAGVIHRDIKPANVLIQPSGDAMLADFGLARVVEGTSTLTGSMLMGTPAYISPEQGKGDSLDPRSDQYSLGVLLYQLTTGQLPFQSDSPMALVMMQIQQPVPRPSRLIPRMNPGLEKVILKSLAKDPEARFQDVAELNRAFQEAIYGGAVDWVELTERPRESFPSGDAGGAQPFAPRQRRTSIGWVVLGLSIPVLALAGWLAFGNQLVGAEDSPLSAPEALPPATQPAGLPPSPTIPLNPVTPTPVTAQACPGLIMVGFERAGNLVSWRLDNGTDQPYKIRDFRVSWPDPDQQQLERITLGGETLIDLDPQGVGSGGESVAIPDDHRTHLEPGDIRKLVLQYRWVDESPGYSLTIIFEGGCQLHTEW